MSTLAEVTTRVYRDLADDGKLVFNDAQVEAFIRDGIVEVSRVAPLTSTRDITPTRYNYEYSITLEEVYRFEVWRRGEGNDANERWASTILPPEPNDHSVPNIDVRRVPSGSVVWLNPSFLRTFPWDEDGETVLFIRLHGYLPYTRPATSASQLGMGWSEEQAVRCYAKWMGFDLLTHDRALFQQWQSQTNNTDVSPVMMMNMNAMAGREWERLQGRLLSVRRHT